MQELDGRGILSDTDRPLSDWQSTYIAAEEQGKVQEAIDKTIKGRKIFELEHRVLRADGYWGWVFSRAFLILDDKGEIIEWFGTAADITDRKRTEEALLEAKDKSEKQKMVYEPITSGMGIEAEDLPKIFDRYYRVTGRHMFSTSGFGIGLYLCSEIIHRHHGKIWTESDFGKGSTFSFSLPLTEE